MTQLRRDAAYIRSYPHPERNSAVTLTDFDEEVYDLLSSPHTVISVTKTLAGAGKRPASRAQDDWEADLESRVADAMLHLLQAERIELSPDS